MCPTWVAQIYMSKKLRITRVIEPGHKETYKMSQNKIYNMTMSSQQKLRSDVHVAFTVSVYDVWVLAVTQSTQQGLC